MTENVHEIWSDDDLDRAPAALHSEVDSNERALARARTELTSVAETKPRRHWGRWAAAAAVVAALVAGLLVVQTGSTPPQASAAPRSYSYSYAPDNSRGDTELLVYAADALRSGLIPADVRAALYRALGKLPGLEITDRLANLDGRTGMAFGMSDGNTRHEIIIDPETGAFIGERETTIRDLDGLKAGTVMAYTSVTTAVVDAAGTRPAS